MQPVENPMAMAGPQTSDHSKNRSWLEFQTLPPGKRLQFANWNMSIEIVDLPIYPSKNDDFP